MNKIVSHILAMVSGGAIGVLATRTYFKAKYEKMYTVYPKSSDVSRTGQVERSDIDNVNNPGGSSDEQQDKISVSSIVPPETIKRERVDYSGIIKKANYSNNGPLIPGDGIESPMDPDEEPYVISPDELGEYTGYTVIELTYYADHVLADDMDEKIDCPTEIVGRTALDSFGRYEEDSVCVRNDRKKCDYQILLDCRNYSDVMSLHR